MDHHTRRCRLLRGVPGATGVGLDNQANGHDESAAVARREASGRWDSAFAKRLHQDPTRDAGPHGPFLRADGASSHSPGTGTIPVPTSCVRPVENLGC